MKPALLATLIALSCNAHADSSTAGLEQKLDQLQQEMTALKQQLAAEKAARDKQVDSAVKAAVASVAPASNNDTTIGGYGEAVYNNYRDGSVKDQADLRRFVLFFGHRFNDKLRLYSELEVEHALVESGQGELAMEQAYLEYGLTPSVNLRAGLMLMPLGFLNETHEPPTFYGAERNEVESRIIPSTWRELGFGVQGRVLDSALEYNAVLSPAWTPANMPVPVVACAACARKVSRPLPTISHCMPASIIVNPAGASVLDCSAAIPPRMG